MTISRRDAILSTLFGTSLLGLRTLATGLPASFLMNPRRAFADTPSLPTKPQYIIMSTSGGGDSINAGAPGTYGVFSDIIHSPDIPNMGPTQIQLGSQTVTAAKPWASLPANVLNRTAFFHLMTNTPIHPMEPNVLKLMGATVGNDMLPSLLARQLAPALGTIQTQPISLGATTPAEAISFNGAPQPIISPTALAATLAAPTGPLTNVGALRSIRDQTLNQYYSLYKNGASPAQQAYMDSMISSQTQLRNINDKLLALLASIQDDSADSQCLAASILIQMKVTPVISIHIPFGGDNHFDNGLVTETAETQSGVQTINNLMTNILPSASVMIQGTDTKLSDAVTLMTLNVFGRTLKVNQPGVPATNGRNHNPNLQTSVVIGKGFNAGVFGAIAPVGTDYGATPIDSTTGMGSSSGDIVAVDTLAAFGQTMFAAIGGDASAINTQSNTSSKPIKAALAP